MMQNDHKATEQVHKDASMSFVASFSLGVLFLERWGVSYTSVPRGPLSPAIILYDYL